mgnify:CR=1 FL=1
MKSPYVEIELTDRQKRELFSIQDYAEKMFMEGHPGMVLGQFHDSIFRVGFVDNKRALKIQKIIDKTSVGKMYSEVK